MNSINRFQSLKILSFWNRLEKLATTGICEPVQVIIYPTNKCNSQCTHCIMKSERANEVQLTSDLLMSLPIQALSVGAGMVLFSGGGEPTLHPNLELCADECKKVGLETSLNTNGIKFIDYFSFDNVRFSLDACTPETYFKCKGANYFDKVVQNIKAGIESCPSTEFGISMVVSKDNFIDMLKFPEWALKTFAPTFVHVRPAYGTTFTQEEKMHFVKLQYVYRNDPRVQISTERSEIFCGKQFKACQASPLRCVVNADGRLSICQDRFIKFGDLYKESLHTAWYSQEHMDVISGVKIAECPRCVDGPYNEIIEQAVMNDGLKRWFV